MSAVLLTCVAACDRSTRELSVRRKLNAMPVVFEGRSVLLVDDSIVRGTTMSQIVDMVRRAGASKVSVPSSPLSLRNRDFQLFCTPNPLGCCPAQAVKPQGLGCISEHGLCRRSYAQTSRVILYLKCPNELVLGQACGIPGRFILCLHKMTPLCLMTGIVKLYSTANRTSGGFLDGPSR